MKKFQKILSVMVAVFVAVFFAMAGSPVTVEQVVEVAPSAVGAIDTTLSNSTSDLITVMVLLLPVIFLFAFFDKIMSKF